MWVLRHSSKGRGRQVKLLYELANIFGRILWHV